MWNTGQDGLEELTGTVVQGRLQAGAETFELGIPLVSVSKVTSVITGLVLTNFIARERLISLIEQEEQISLTIMKPLEIRDGSDIDAASNFRKGATVCRTPEKNRRLYRAVFLYHRSGERGARR